MKSWSYGINSYHKTASIYLHEGPWWAFFLYWFADRSCALVPRWHIPLLRGKRVTVDGEAYTFGEYYGTIGDLYHMAVCQRLKLFADSKLTKLPIPVGWDECKALFYDKDKEFWDEEELQGEEMRREEG